MRNRGAIDSRAPVRRTFQDARGALDLAQGVALALGHGFHDRAGHHAVEGLVHGLAGSGHLLRHVFAGTAAFDHVDQAAHLAFDAFEPVDDVALVLAAVGGRRIAGSRLGRAGFGGGHRGFPKGR